MKTSTPTSSPACLDHHKTVGSHALSQQKHRPALNGRLLSCQQRRSLRENLFTKSGHIHLIAFRDVTSRDITSSRRNVWKVDACVLCRRKMMVFPYTLSCFLPLCKKSGCRVSIWRLLSFLSHLSFFLVLCLLCVVAPRLCRLLETKMEKEKIAARKIDGKNVFTCLQQIGYCKKKE